MLNLLLYEFEATPSGTYMYHTHFSLQLDRGLVGPLIVEEKKPRFDYDREYTLLVTDFLPGEPKPLRLAASAGRGPMGGPMSGMMGGPMGGMMGMMGMQVPPYAALLINGRSSDDPYTFEVTYGERVRLRLINPSGATTYRIAIGGHPMHNGNQAERSM